MTDILAPGDFPAVRAAIGAEITATDLPDAVISLPIYHAEAEAWMVANIPDVDDLAAPLLARAKNAVIYYLAALICPTMPSVTHEQDQGLSYQRRPVDRGAQAAGLFARAGAILNELLDALELGDGEPLVPDFFRLTSGTRL